MRFYAVEFFSGKNTTTGTQNPRTGYMSIAHSIEVFSSKNARDEWVNNGKITADMRGNCRKAVSKNELRGLNLGLSVADFEQHLEMLDIVE